MGREECKAGLTLRMLMVVWSRFIFKGSPVLLRSLSFVFLLFLFFALDLIYQTSCPFCLSVIVPETLFLRRQILVSICSYCRRSVFPWDFPKVFQQTLHIFQHICVMITNLVHAFPFMERVRMRTSYLPLVHLPPRYWLSISPGKLHIPSKLSQLCHSPALAPTCSEKCPRLRTPSASME